MTAMERVIWRGRKFNRRTVQMLEEVERRMGRPLVYFQGSYNSGVKQSAGTHDGGGAVDCWTSLVDAERLVLHMRRVGFASWHRTPAQGPWGHHVHAIAIGDPELSRGARAQVIAYYDGRNGLANRGRDDGPRVTPIPIWHYKEEDDVTPEELRQAILDVLKSDEGQSAISDALLDAALNEHSGQSAFHGKSVRWALKRATRSAG